MWIHTGEKLLNATDPTRVKFRTNISKAILDDLRLMADQNHTHVNYLIEVGLETMLADGVLAYSKDLRPTDRVQYKTTYDKDLLAATREFAAQNGVFVNNLIEHSASLIDPSKCKDKPHRARVERGHLLKF